MDKQTLFTKLNMIKQKCIIVDDSELNPSEISIIVRSSSKFRKSLNLKSSITIICDNNKSRVVRFYLLSQLNYTTYTKYLFTDLFKQNANVIYPTKFEAATILLVISYINANDNWMYYRAKHYIAQNINSALSSNALSLFTDSTYINMDISQYSRYSLAFTKSKKFTNRAYRIFSYIIPSKILSFRKRIHIKLTKEKYLSSLFRNNVISKNAQILNVGGASAGVFVKDMNIFLKGNELYEYAGIPNEINIRNILKADGVEINYIPELIDYSMEDKWLKYIYTNCPDLAEYISHDTLSNENLDSLGSFLIKLLDELYRLNICHNDLKPNNIMIIDMSSIYQYNLSDFGCSSYKGSSPWEKHLFWKHYFMKRVCGKYRYSESIIDDAASAYSTYLECGGSEEDENAKQLYKRIGRHYLYYTKNKWIYISNK